MGLVIAIHIIVCALLIIVILIQAGRGGGLVEGFSGVESMFGTKTNAFLTRITSILSVFFFLTCIMLALISARQSRSLLRDAKAGNVTQTAPLQETTQQAGQNPGAESAKPELPKEQTPKAP